MIYVPWRAKAKSIITPKAAAPIYHHAKGGWPYRHPPNSQFVLNTMSPQAQGLVAWWPTLGQHTIHLRELVTGARPTVTGTPVLTMYAEMGAGVDFTGADYLSYTHQPSWQLTGELTLSAFVTLDTLASNRGFITKHYDNEFYCYFQAGGDLIWFQGGGTVTLTPGQTTTSAVQLLTIRRSGTPGNWTISFFRNGLFVTSDTIATDPVAGSDPVLIGAGWSTRQWDGLLFDTRIYNRALPDAEVAALFNPATRWELYRPVARFWAGGVAISLLISGETTWGHDTAVAETNVRDFSGNWTGTGTIENSGDAERLVLDASEYMVSEVVDTGAVTVELLQNNYDPSGDDVTLEFRQGTTEANCLAAVFGAYSVPFLSDGFVQIRLTATV